MQDCRYDDFNLNPAHPASDSKPQCDIQDYARLQQAHNKLEQDYEALR